jgi:methionyl-tRNA formyltransferase
LFYYGRLVEARGIPVHTTTDINADETIRFITNFRPDLIVILLFAQILKQPVLDIPERGVINFHPSLLPRYAGLMPVFWCLANGERETGATVHSVDVGIDSGEILAQAATPVTARDTEHSLYARICCLGASLIDDVISRLERGEKPPPVDTSAAEASYHSIPDRNAVRRYRTAGRKYFRLHELSRPFDSF